jgi:hemoglobin
MPFSIGEAERDRWLELMGAAMREVEIPAAEAPVIGGFFAQVADMMRNREG